MLTKDGGQFYSSTGLDDWQAYDVSGNKLSQGAKDPKKAFENLRYSTTNSVANNWKDCTSKKPKPDWNINPDVDFDAYKDPAP